MPGHDAPRPGAAAYPPLAGDGAPAYSPSANPFAPASTGTYGTNGAVGGPAGYPPVYEHQRGQPGSQPQQQQHYPPLSVGVPPQQAHAASSSLYPPIGAQQQAPAAPAGYPVISGAAAASAGYPTIGRPAPASASAHTHTHTPAAAVSYPPAAAAAAPPQTGAAPAWPPAAAVAAPAAPAAAAAGHGASGPAAAGAWRLQAPLPPKPEQQLIGPFVRLTDFDPATGVYEASVMLVAHPDLARSQLQVHYALNGTPTTPAHPTLLDVFSGYHFWRFDLRVTLGDAPGTVTYCVGLSGATAPHATHSIHVPARGEAWRWLFYSCNGFHEAEAEKKYGGIGHMWQDLLERHEAMRFHAQVGGGDQIYCDDVWSLPSLLPWLAVDDPHERGRNPFTPTMLQEVEQYYFGAYARHFSHPLFGRALAQIPYVFTYDDHDIFDGWGSYPAHLQHSAVFQGIFAVARRFYLLFQMHANYQNAGTVSRCLGQMAYHQVRSFGSSTVLMAPDTRSLRTATQVLPPQDWDLLFGDVERRIVASNGSVRHLCVLLAVPLVYPKIPVTESLMAGMSGILNRSSEMRNALRNANLPAGALNQFQDADLLDDLKDHWTSAEHVAEREYLVRRLQALAARYAVRVTLLGGDVHVGAYGVLQSHPKVPDRVVDPRFILQVVSSAIGNEPPPAGVIMALETSSMANTSMGDTLEKMVKTFPGKKRLYGGRNYCEVFPLDAPYTEPSTGIPQPPGGLMFALRCETGTAPAWGPVQPYWQVAPLLMPGGNPQAAAALPGGYGHHAHAHAAVRAGAGPGGSAAAAIVGTVAGLLPGQTGQKIQAEVKSLGHKLGNLLQKF